MQYPYKETRVFLISADKRDDAICNTRYAQQPEDVYLREWCKETSQQSTQETQQDTSPNSIDDYKRMLIDRSQHEVASACESEETTILE
jgi:hypothetical protein